MLDAGEYLVTEQGLGTVELLAFWDKDAIDSAATYEVSRDGGNEYQTVTMERVGLTTEVFQGEHEFDIEAANQTIVEQTTTDTSEELAATSNSRLAQEITLANKVIVREVDLDLTINGSPLGNMYVSLVKDDSGLPSTAASDIIAESSAIDISGLSTGTLTVSVGSVLTADIYHVVVRTDAAYKSSFVTGVTSVEIDANSAGSQAASFDGATWTAGASDLTYAIKGIELDLRFRVTSSAGSVNLAGMGILYSSQTGIPVNGIKEIEVFDFDGDADVTSLVVNNFLLNADLVRVYDLNENTVLRHGAFAVNGNSIEFTSGQFFRPGERVRVLVDQTAGAAFDNSDANALLLASNNLGSTDGSIDKSVAGRGIFLRRPDGTLRELIINDSDEIEIYSV